MKHVPPLKLLFDYEWRQLHRDAGFWALMLLFAGCLAFAVWNGARWAAELTGAITEARSDETARYAKLGAEFDEYGTAERRPHYAYDPANPDRLGRESGVRNAIMSVAPLAGLAIGQSDLYPPFYVVSLDDLETVLAAAEIENPQQLLTGRFDAAFVFLYLWPLLILALTYNLVSAERERGTLALLLSQPMDLRAWLRARAGLRFAVLFFPVLVLAIVGPLFFPGEGTVLEGWAQALHWISLLFVYGIFWAALAAVVAWRGRSSSRNALALSFLWLVLVVVVPAGSNLVLQAVYPMPSRMEYVGAMRDALDEARREGERLLGRYMQDHPEMVEGITERELSYFAAQRLMVENRVREDLLPVQARYEEQAARQRRWVRGLQFLSPAILLQDGLGDAAGVGMDRHRHFREQVRGFHVEWQGFLHPLILRQRLISSFEAIPEFEYRREPWSARARRAGMRMLGIGIPAAALLWIASRRAVFRRVSRFMQ